MARSSFFLRVAAAALLLLSTLVSASLRAQSSVDESLVIHAHVPVPKPPCFSAFNPSLETSCSRTIATDPRTKVSIRAYEAAGATITFLSALEPGELNYQEGLESGIEVFLPYFSPGFNREEKPVNRTVPIVSTRLGSPSDPVNYKWASGMALPASIYPSSATAPAPMFPMFEQFVTPFAANSLVAVYHFVTPALAADADWAAAVAFLTANVPRGYSAAEGIAPVFAIYDGRAATTPRNNEVWLSVVRK